MCFWKYNNELSCYRPTDANVVPITQANDSCQQVMLHIMTYVKDRKPERIVSSYYCFLKVTNLITEVSRAVTDFVPGQSPFAGC